MGKTSIPIRAPLFDRVKVIAKDEDMPVQELVDYILRSFADEYDFEEEEADEESDEELSDEDVESECQDEKT
jgi:lipoate-protein ligase A